MSGHSKWSTIKHKKGAADAKRGKIFSKLAREITVSAKTGGPDPSSNIRLRSAIAKARSQSMPNKNIENAIKSAIGNKTGNNFEEVVYEGYGPDGVAFYISCLTDNKKRTVADIRALLSKNGGSLGESGSVAWQFEQRGVIHVMREVMEEAVFLELALDCGADDVLAEQEGYVVYTIPSDFSTVSEALKEALDKQGKHDGIASAEIVFVAKNQTQVSQATGSKIEKIIATLEDLDDVQSVADNHKL